MTPSFPDGAPGVGLLLLRASVAASLLLIASASTSQLAQPLAIAAVAALVLGLGTRVIAAVTLIAPLLAWTAGGANGPLAIVHAIDAVALMLTGAGAISLDAALFGRKRIRLPDLDDTDG